MNIESRTYKNKLVEYGKLAFLFTGIVFMLSLSSCENEMAKIKVVAKSEEPPKIVADDLEVLFSDSTVIRSMLQTPKLIWHEEGKDPYQEFPDGVKIVKYDSRMSIVSSITAQYAKYFLNDEKWEAKNNVVAVNQKGDTLKTEYMVWDNKKGKISSDQFVKIVQKDQIYTGIGFESNLDFSSYHIKNLQGHIYVDVKK